MTLTPQQIEEARKKHGITPISSNNSVSTRVSSLDDAWGATSTDDASFAEKISKSATNLKDIGVGALKSLGSSASELMSVENSPTLALAGAVDPSIKEKAKEAGDFNKEMTGLTMENMTPKNDAESVGNVLGTIAQVATPFGKTKVAQEVGLGLKKGADALVTGTQEAVAGVKIAQAERKAKKALDTALEAVTPRTTELTPDEYSDLLKKQKITPKTPTEPAKYIVSPEEKAVAEKYSSLLQGKDPVNNSVNVMTEIVNKDAEVGKFLEKNNGIYTPKELKNYIIDKLGDVNDITVSGNKIKQLKSKLLNDFMLTLKKNDMKSLWESRKMFDKRIEDSFAGSPTLQKEAKKAFRNAVQDFISERTPNLEYKGKMTDMRELFDLQDILTARAIKERGASAFRQWMKENPTKVKLLETGAGVAGLAGLYGLVF